MSRTPKTSAAQHTPFQPRAAKARWVGTPTQTEHLTGHPEETRQGPALSESRARLCLRGTAPRPRPRAQSSLKEWGDRWNDGQREEAASPLPNDSASDGGGYASRPGGEKVCPPAQLPHSTENYDDGHTQAFPGQEGGRPCYRIEKC